MASLANQTISSTYDGLIKTSTDQPVGVSGVQLLEDGVGNTLALSVGRANQGVTVTGTLTATTLTGTISATSVLADGVTATTQSAGDNSTKVATTAYVDAQVTASDLDFAGDAGTGAVDLDSQTFTIAGTANEIETSASGQTITIGLPSSVTVGTLTATTLAGTLSTAAQTNITSVGTLSSLAVSGNLTIDTNTLYVDATGNKVGIRTSSPNNNLHVYDATSNVVATFESGDANVYISFKDVNTSGYDDVFIGADDQDFVIHTGTGSEKLRVDGSGNVGIGSTNIVGKFEVNIGSSAAYFTRTAGDNGGSSPAFGILTDSTGNRLYSWGDGMKFYTGAVGGSPAERLRIDSSGNIGIGRTPTDTLDIQGGITVQQAADIKWQNTARDTTYGAINSLASALTFKWAGSEVMRIDSSGNLGIGTSSPSEKVEIQMPNTGRLYFLGTGGSSTEVKSSGSLALSCNPLSNIIFKGWDAGAGETERMRIDSSGNVGIGQAPDTDVLLDINGGSDYTKTQLRIQASSASTRNLTIGKDSSTLAYIDQTGSSSELRLRTYTTSSFITLYTNGTERVRVLPTGGITFNGDTAAANALDDYEEGDWNVRIAFGGASAGVTYAANSIGHYTKIGRQVTVTGRLQLTNKGTSTGNATLTGLPFTIGNNTRNYAGVCLGQIYLISFADMMNAYGVLGSTTITLQETTNAGTLTSLTNANFSNNSELMVSFTYFI